MSDAKLTTFSKCMFAHIANEAKVSKQHVEASFASWAATRYEQEELAQWTSDRFNALIENPRTDRMNAYQDYMQERMGYWSELTGSPRNMDIISKIAQQQLPPVLVDGTETTHIYTKNIQVL